MSMYKEYYCPMCEDMKKEEEMVCYRNDDRFSFENCCRDCCKEMVKEIEVITGDCILLK